jgi:hypothetical protein
MPVALLVSAPRIPAVRVPCHELFSTAQLLPLKTGLLTSVELIQSPGSEGSGSQPSPSLAVRNVLPAAPLPPLPPSGPTKS